MKTGNTNEENNADNEYPLLGGVIFELKFHFTSEKPPVLNDDEIFYLQNGRMPDNKIKAQIMSPECRFLGCDKFGNFSSQNIEHLKQTDQNGVHYTVMYAELPQDKMAEYIKNYFA